MNFNFFVKSGFFGFILLFVIQVLGVIRGLLIQSGFMDVSIDQTLLGTKLIIAPIIFFTISIIFSYYGFIKTIKKIKRVDFLIRKSTFLC
ncbi:hypothetical protein AJL38_09550 [Listeria monocytogenes]|nr:hypothetical protein AJL38_09550 [Listeria monocytogenes]